MRGVSRYKVELLPHAPAWTAEFEQLKAQILDIWKENILDIQHVDSTAVPTLCAKPILDITILPRSVAAMNVSVLENSTMITGVLRRHRPLRLRPLA